MSSISKYIKVHPDVLVQWTFDNENYVSENYKIITNLSDNKKRSFLSTHGLNIENLNLVQIDPVLRKYTVVDPGKFNFLKEQDFSSAPTPYDTVKVYFPTNYDFSFNNFIGFYMKIFTYGFENRNIYELSNIFFDESDPYSGSTLINLSIPFIYDEKEWGKYFEFQVPSINFISNQRIIDNTQNIVYPNTINSNLALSEGLSQTGPIFVDYQFIITKENTLGTNYFFVTESYRTSFPKTPEFETLSVQIQESTDGDFFEIYGTYGESNENLDNFIEEMMVKGRRIRIEYDVYLYEENIQTSKQTFAVTDSFSQKLYYRPIITFSNTTAAIKVEMRVIDLIDMSQISRFTTIGIRQNIQKYGKKLISLDITNINKLKIYNAKPDQIILSKDYLSGTITTEVIQVPYPQLIEVGKIVANSPKSQNGYKGMGLLNIIITPFDNIIQFRLGTMSAQNQLELYNLAQILQNSDLLLIFKSDSEVIEKSIYKETTNDYTNGIINYKIDENDLNVLKKIYDKGYTNFYLTLNSNNIKTLLYSGTYTFFEDIVFIDDNSTTIQDQNIKDPSPPATTTDEWQQGFLAGMSNNWTPNPGKTVLIYVKYKNSTSATITPVSTNAS